jgi:hypothetical protein
MLSHFRRGKDILQTGGLTALVKRGLLFMMRLFFEYETYYLSESYIADAQNANKADFMPRIDNFTWKVIHTNLEADALEAGGLEFRSQFPTARGRLDKGATAFCIFVGKELGSISWVAMNEQAQASLSEPPYRVDFSNNEACTGAFWTNPKFRRMNLGGYASFKRRQYLLERGILTTRGAFAKWNTIAPKAFRFTQNIYAEARYFRFLWWQSWKEKPLT